jgi:hypothetical protein
MALNAPLNYYNFANNIITIGGIRIGMFATDGGVSYAPKSDKVQSDVGADGIVHYSGLNDDRLEVTLTLMEDSPSVNYLLGLLNAQQLSMRTGGIILPIPYGHTDPSLGDIITSRHTIFMSLPEVAKQRTIGTRVFKLELPYAQGSLQLASLVAPLLFD